MTQDAIPEPTDAPEVPETDAARRVKGPLPDREHLTMHREDLLAGHVADLQGLVDGQSLIIANLQLELMKHQHDEELRKVREHQAKKIAAAKEEIGVLATKAAASEVNARKVWEDISNVYEVDFKSHAYDDETGVVLKNGSPVPTNKEKS